MKDEEMAEQFADNISGLELTCSLLSAKDKSHAYRLGRYEGFLAGLKAGRPQWHDLRKDPNDLPTDTTVLYLVRVYSWDFGFSHLYKKNGTYIPTVCEWNGEYFKALDSMAYSNARNIKSCFAWKEIVLPELKESE